MNEVISIELSKQVFWIERDSYKCIRNYLNNIEQQLIDDDCSKEIMLDIELRLAELMYEINSDKQKAISKVQLNAIIEQIGFIDSENLETRTTRRIYLDERNKIIAGVCAGLSTKFGISVFIIRLSLLGLVFLFGLGILLYLIFWISFENKNDRNNSLAAEGKTQIAKHIAERTERKVYPFLKLQKIIFLPFSILGVLLTAIDNSFITSRKIYVFLYKNILLVMLSVMVISFSVNLNDFIEERLFPSWIEWLLIGSVVYLLVLISAIFIREFYISRPHIKVAKRLKVAAIIPLFMITAGSIFLASQMITHDREIVTRSYLLKGNKLSIELLGINSEREIARDVNIVLKVTSDHENYIKVSVLHSSNGSDIESVKQNIQSINYFYSFKNNKLELSNYFRIDKDSYDRDQNVSVVVEIPQYIELSNSHDLIVMHRDDEYEYSFRANGNSNRQYLSAGKFFHESNKINWNRASHNEQKILWEKFCEQFFLSERWHCSRNVETRVTNNEFLNPTFIGESAEIEKIRIFLSLNNTIELDNLTKINDIIEFLKIKHPDLNEFQDYVQHLVLVKTKILPDKFDPS